MVNKCRWSIPPAFETMKLKLWPLYKQKKAQTKNSVYGKMILIILEKLIHKSTWLSQKE